MIETLARLARVIDKYTIVLNRGAADGVQLNDKFLIYGLGEDVIDPETGKSLGPLEIVRGRVRVEHLQDKVCTARTDTTIKIPGRRRTIERKPTNIQYAMGSTDTKEEIEEEHSYELQPLTGAEVGDYARPY